MMETTFFGPDGKLYVKHDDSEVPHTLEGLVLDNLGAALEYGRKLALSDVYGDVDPFTAVEWRKTLPHGWQREVEAAIVHVYHTT